MKKTLLYILLAAVWINLSGCIKEDSFNNSPEGNFEALWKIINERYCFLEYKQQEYGLDWNEVHHIYKNRISPKMNSSQLFEVLEEMVNELRDGHVNLSSYDRISQYRAWYDNYPRNFSDTIQSNYLGKDYAYIPGIKYTILEDNIGYAYCGSFQGGISANSLDRMLSKLALCDGLIIDVRNNGGGMLTSAEKLAERFTNERVLVAYMSYKTGPEKNDFSTPEEVYLNPATDRVRWQKPVIVLTNRRSYSSTNDFVCKMKRLPLVTVVGDKTGGGSGLPFSSELPNGWSIRFSACPMYDADMNQIEFGIDPDVKIDMKSSDYQRGKDSIIEKAREILRKSNFSAKYFGS